MRYLGIARVRKKELDKNNRKYEEDDNMPMSKMRRRSRRDSSPSRTIANLMMMNVYSIDTNGKYFKKRVEK